MKNALLLTLTIIFISSCASVEGVMKNENCVVWKNQKFWGPYSIEVVAKKTEWKGNCKSYTVGCDEVSISLDENNNVLSKTDILGKIQNNELHFAEKHTLSDVLNFTGVRVYPDLKVAKSSITTEKITIEESFQYNDKCSPEESIVGAIALGLINKSQQNSKNIK